MMNNLSCKGCLVLFALIGCFSVAIAAVPSGYTEVEYVEATAAQYIDTGYTPVSTTKIEVEFQVTKFKDPSSTTDRAYIFGVYGSSGGRCQFSYGGMKLFQGWGGSYNQDDASGGDLNKHTVVLNQGAFSIDGVAKRVFSWSGTSKDLLLFALRGDGTIAEKNYSNSRIFSASITEGGVAKRTFVPVVRDLDSAPGLYDTVNNQFYKSATSTPLVAPPKKAGVPTISAVTIGGNVTDGVWARATVKEGTNMNTKVTCYIGEDQADLPELKSWNHNSTNATYVATNTLAQYGRTYYAKYRLLYTEDQVEKTNWTAVASYFIAATNYWVGASGGNWSTADNWSLAMCPNENLTVFVTNATHLVAGKESIAAKSMYLTRGSVYWDFSPKTKLEAAYLHVGLSAAATLTMTNGEVRAKGLSFDYNGSTYLQTGGSMVVTDEAVNLGDNSHKNKHLTVRLTSGAYMSAWGVIASRDDGYFGVESGSCLRVWTNGGLKMSSHSKMVVDNGIVTNLGATVISQDTGGSVLLVVKNGGYFKQENNNQFRVGARGTGKVVVADDGELDASAQTMSLGAGSDGNGLDSCIDLTNGTVRCATLSVASDTRYAANYSVRVIGEDALLAVGGNATFGATSYQGGKNRTSGSANLFVSNGTVQVGKALNVGASYERVPDTVTVMGKSARVSTGDVVCTTNAIFKFVIPENGFANDVIAATNSIAFALAAPTPIEIDASACASTDWMTLFTASNQISNYTNQQISVTSTYENREYEVLEVKSEDKLVGLKFRLISGAPSGLTIIYR